MTTLLCASGLVLMACACPGKAAAPTSQGGSAAPVGAPSRDGCAAVRAHVEQLYRAEAQIAEPRRVDEAVADNTAMVMADCEVAPAKVSACVSAATTVHQIETKCLSRLDETGNPKT